ncbi:hypothetical protein Riv7116_3626 [Rivularia sp. PCC 7116]|uniref:hypothetical protein n=1 Tax=Rivularia sp. PCC 7116 TaxID=373994 RepID=UPI00029EF8B7|nr:hypothetical protein [Rivularia sp. PCC 7116]AFY56076.1 hypothetical protein Riv7116_3626 [Rivularia sp. PCC 7116]
MTFLNSTKRYSKLACLISLIPIIIIGNPLKASAYSTQLIQASDAENNSIPTVVAQRVPQNLGSPDEGRRRGGSSR